MARPAPARTRDSMGTKFEIQNQTGLQVVQSGLHSERASFVR